MDREKHKEVIDDFLYYLNSRSNQYILKGGTALMECYGLDRFSEDIDFDGKDREQIGDLVNSFCSVRNYDYQIAKDTNILKQYLIHYYNECPNPLKIEVSFRSKNIPEEKTTIIHGIHVYTIDALASLKCSAYMGRDRIRDLYDVTFITNNYFDMLSDGTKWQLQSALTYKGLDYADYIISNQRDDLINEDDLVENFLNAYDKVGLMLSEKELEETQEYYYEEDLER